MRAVPVIAAVLILAQLAGAAVLAVAGLWLLAVLPLVGAVALAVVWACLVRQMTKATPYNGYVERERIGY